MKCDLFRSLSPAFRGEILAKDASAEIAIDAETGLPVQVSCKTEKSSSVVNFERAELNLKIPDSYFQPPKGMKFETWEPDGLGGLRRSTTGP